jgi:hypothetical protein
MTHFSPAWKCAPVAQANTSATPASDDAAHTAPVIAVGPAEAVSRAKAPHRGQYEPRAEDDAAQGHAPAAGIATPIRRMPQRRRSWRSGSHDPACTCPPCVALRAEPPPAENADVGRAVPPKRTRPTATTRPGKRSPLLREGERFAIIAHGWIGKLGSPTNAVIFEALCLHANHEREAWPSLKTLSSLCYGLSFRSITRGLRGLEKVGAITCLSLGKGNEPSHYRLNLSRS